MGFSLVARYGVETRGCRLAASIASRGRRLRDSAVQALEQCEATVRILFLSIVDEDGAEGPRPSKRVRFASPRNASRIAAWKRDDFRGLSAHVTTALCPHAMKAIGAYARFNRFDRKSAPRATLPSNGIALKPTRLGDRPAVGHRTLTPRT